MDKYIPAPICISQSGNHAIEIGLEKGPSVWFGRCKHCMMRFALISEFTVNELGLKITTPERLENGNNK